MNKSTKIISFLLIFLIFLWNIKVFANETWVWTTLDNILPYNQNSNFDIFKANTDKETKKTDILKFSNEWWGQRGIHTPPWSFKDYSFLTEDFLWVIKANLMVSDSLLKVEENFRIWNNTTFENDYLDALELVKNDKTITEEHRKKTLEYIDTPAMKWFINHLLYAFLQMEHSWDTTANPWNWQWIFQLVTYSKTYPWHNLGPKHYNERLYYTTRKQYNEIYKPDKILKTDRKSYLLEMIDMMVFTEKIKHLSRMVKEVWEINNPKSRVKYNEQLDLILKTYDKVLHISDDERKKLIIAIIRKDDNYVWSFLLNHKDIYQYWIQQPEDMYIWLEEIKVAFIGNVYNWLWANFTRNANYRKYWLDKQYEYPWFNVFDNNYVSNTRKYGVCFYVTATDHGKFDHINTREAVIMQYLKYNYPKSYQEKQVAFGAMLNLMKEQNKLPASANCP